MPSRKISDETPDLVFRDDAEYVIAVNGQNFKISGATLKVVRKFATVPKRYFDRAQGTESLPNAVEAGNILGQMIWRAYSGFSYDTVSTIEAVAVENHDASNKGTKINFYTTPAGSTTPELAFTLTDKGYMQPAKRTIGQQPNMASAENMTMPDSNVVLVADTANTLKRLSRAGWTAGSIIWIIFPEGITVNHLEEISGDYVPYSLGAKIDFTFNETLVIAFEAYALPGTTTITHWKEAGGTTIAKTLDTQFNVYAKPVTIPAYNLAAGGVISNFVADDLLGCTVSNGNEPEKAGVAINGNNVTVGIGDLYGFKVIDSTGNTKIELPCCEGNEDINFLYCLVTGRQFYITGAKTVIPQDTYLKPQINGFEEREFEDGSKIFVARKNDGSLIEL